VIDLIKDKYGIVLIGCGRIGANHAEDIYYRDNVKMVGVVDSNEAAAKLFARKYGAESYATDYQQYLTRDDVDIIIIATYTSTHLAILKDCVAHGKHVLCEKPVAENLAHSLEFLDIVKNAPVKVLVGHILRHNKSYQEIRRMIQNGAIGQPRLFRLVQNHQALNWERYKALLKDCSPIVDCGVHYVDIAQWFTGDKIVRVGGIASKLDDDIPDGTYNFGMLNATFSSGAVLNYEVGWSKNIRAANVKDFVGDKGYIKLIMSYSRGDGCHNGDLIHWYDATKDKLHAINVGSIYKDMYGQLSQLIKMIEEEGYIADPSPEDVESTMRVVFAADDAIKAGTNVNLDPVTQHVLPN